MMMSSTTGYLAPHAAFPQYASSDAAFEEWSRHLAASQVSWRPSRTSNGPLSGSAMRVTKPGSSTASSPRSSILHGKRRTLLSDGNAYLKRHHIMDQAALPVPATALSPEPTKRSQRPMSWHPASSHFHTHQPQVYSLPQTQLRQQPASTNPYYMSAQGRWNDQGLYTHYQQVSPMPSSYSCQASPTAFSPSCLPVNDFNSQSYFPVDSQGWTLPTHKAPGFMSPPVESCNISPAMESNVDYTESFPPLFHQPNGSAATTANYGTDGTHGSTMSDWKSFVEQGFDKTFPPTPENLPQIQQLKPAVRSEESTAYEPLPESDDDGEVLVGMGLYDAPDKYEADPGLNNYRSTLSSLFGGGAPKLPEQAGKGLKLEETWQPPESEDEDEDEDDEKEEGEDA